MRTKVADVENYGLALGTNREDIIPGEKMTGHTGSAYGVYSSMFFQSKEKFRDCCNYEWKQYSRTKYRRAKNHLIPGC